MPAYINVDTQDPERITPYWCGLLGVQVQPIRDNGQYVVLAPAPSLGGMMLVFQRVKKSDPGWPPSAAYPGVPNTPKRSLTASGHGPSGARTRSVAFPWIWSRTWRAAAPSCWW
jgi:hypothetical protein